MDIKITNQELEIQAIRKGEEPECSYAITRIEKRNIGASIAISKEYQRVNPYSSTSIMKDVSQRTNEKFIKAVKEGKLIDDNDKYWRGIFKKTIEDYRKKWNWNLRVKNSDEFFVRSTEQSKLETDDDELYRKIDLLPDREKEAYYYKYSLYMDVPDIAIEMSNNTGKSVSEKTVKQYLANFENKLDSLYDEYNKVTVRERFKSLFNWRKIKF